MRTGSGLASRDRYASGMAAGLLIVGALARLIPHPANFTPTGGTSLFAGARLRGWTAYLVPLILMAATDPLLSAIYGYPLFTPVTPVIYGAFLINVWIGRRLLRSVTGRRVALASALCSVQFFVLTNLGVWLAGGLYPHTGSGLVICYAAALPFLGRTMAGDLLYAGCLFGADAWLQKRVPMANRQLSTDAA